MFLLTIISFGVGILGAVGGWVLAFASIKHENANDASAA